MGCKIVPEPVASFVLKGAVEGAVKGALSDKAGNFGFNRRYSGGSLRDQAHALSNDVIKALTGKLGIAQTRILFKMKTGQRTEEVFLSDFDGHKPVALTNDKTLVGSPKWSPDNLEVYYTSWLKRGGIENTTVIRQNMKTGVRDVMARYRGLNTGGALSPQGFLAMILSKGGSPDVYVAPPAWEFMKNLKGEGLNRICATNEEESGVSWSPDGKWICFATRARGKRMLVKVAAQGGNMIRVPTNGVLNPSGDQFGSDGLSTPLVGTRIMFPPCAATLTSIRLPRARVAKQIHFPSGDQDTPLSSSLVAQIRLRPSPLRFFMNSQAGGAT
jgi:hypothetical protein